MKNLQYSLLFFSFISFDVMAGVKEQLTGRVLKIMTLPSTYTTYDSSAESYTMIYVEGLTKACGQQYGLARVAIGTNHSAHDSVLSLALSAHATGKSVEIAYLDSCNVKSNSWDFSYMFLNEE